MKIEFIEVGRRKTSWTAEVKALTEAAIVRAVKSKGALMSSEVGAVISDDGKYGIILVGGLRTVGKFRVPRDDAAEQSVSA